MIDLVSSAWNALVAFVGGINVSLGTILVLQIPVLAGAIRNLGGTGADFDSWHGADDESLAFGLDSETPRSAPEDEHNWLDSIFSFLGCSVCEDNDFCGINFCGINPASGLPIMDDSLIDSAGNPFGMNSFDIGSDDWSGSSSFDSDWSSSSSGCGWD